MSINTPDYINITNNIDRQLSNLYGQLNGLPKFVNSENASN
jgi:hypothetical protein